MANSTLPNYMNKSTLVSSNKSAGGGVQVINPALITGNKEAQNMLSSADILQGIECTPYQFMDSVDRRYTTNSITLDTGSSANCRYIGQKYGQKVISQMPLVFFTPCEPVFMQDFDDDDKSRILGYLLSGNGDELSFVMDKNAQYYGVSFAYSDYYSYVNMMLGSIAYYLGIQDEEIYINGELKKIRNINWARACNDAFKTYFSANENVIFFADSLSSVSLSFTNNTTQSSLASQINGFSDQVHELQFLLGGDESVISDLMNTSNDSISSISTSISDMLGNLGGGIVGSLADSGVNTILNGGKIIFPEIWADSSHDESYSLNFKLRSPDHDNISIFLNILKPYCLLLGLTLPRVIKGNANGYRSPFLIKASSRGIFNINMGMIESMTVEKGEECQWNDAGLPTQMDISISIKNLYTHLAMSGFDDSGYLITNTQYQDFLANTAGMNVMKFNSDLGDRIDYKVYELSNAAISYPGRAYNEINNAISNLVYNVVRRI
jgi:hypothetical protein